MDRMRGVFSRAGEELLRKQKEDLLGQLADAPDDADTLFKLGVLHVRLGEIESARGVYRRLRELNPELAGELLDIIYEV